MVFTVVKYILPQDLVAYIMKKKWKVNNRKHLNIGAEWLQNTLMQSL